MTRTPTVVERVNRHARRAALGGAALCLAIAASAAQNTSSTGATAAVSEWVTPRFTSTAVESKTLTLKEYYDYTEASYTPPYTISTPVPVDQARWETPEQVMLSRISAMMLGDYEAWLSHYDPASRDFIAWKNAERGDTPETWLALWKDRLRVMRFKLKRRIQTGPYVIITYEMVTLDGKDASGGLELPVVFREFEDRWYATQELWQDGLVALSPWVSGKSIVEVTGK